jgi:small subunit ribosomal protein S8
MVNDPTDDLVTRIKNAAARGRSKIMTPASKMRARLLDVLADEGFIRGYHLVHKPGAFPEFEVELKYLDGAPVIVDIGRISKPRQRVYSSIRDLKAVNNGLGISILSRPDPSLKKASSLARERQDALGISEVEERSQASLALRLRMLGE